MRAAIWAFIGVKLVLHALRENSQPFVNNGERLSGVPEVSTPLSLCDHRARRGDHGCLPASDPPPEGADILVGQRARSIDNHA
jgi:hypothetical protein